MIPVETQLRHLSLCDVNELPVLAPRSGETLGKKAEEELSEKLREISRGSAQLLINALFSLPTTWSPEGVLAILPPTTSTPSQGKQLEDRLPREKPLPKEKALTRWERFAKAKGIVKKKKGQVWDEQLKAFKPKHGYIRPAAFEGGVKPVDKDWLVEISPGQDPMADLFEDKKQEKATLKQKQEKRQKRNLEEAYKVTNPAKEGGTRESGTRESGTRESGTKEGDTKEAQKQLTQRALWLAKKSTTTLGRDDKTKSDGIKIKNQKRKVGLTS